MTRKLFGTDGIRGRANAGNMTAEVALRVAMAAGRYFRGGGNRRRVVIGKDTRLSGYMLEPALVSGFTSMGMEVITFGPIPTPAVGMLTASMRADLGVMISASHNQYFDNGIKLFGPDGYKLSDEIESEIERLMDVPVEDALAESRHLGRARRLEDSRGRYIEFVKATFPDHLRLDGLKIVVDCANGAAYRVAPTVLEELGAEVVAIAVSPDGFNINDNCGATAIDTMCQAVVTHGADLGIALDGDADRVVMADEHGAPLDGDQLMALIAGTWLDAGRLRGNGVVATVMSNLGLERHLESRGLDLIRTSVGDRYVVEHMRANDYNLGGEQSGHIVLTDYATTGDGLIAGLQVLAAIVETGKPASETCRLFTPLPQLLKNVEFNGGKPLDDKSVKAAIKDGEAALGDTGRLLIRPSGTEPVIRVMAEGDDDGKIERVVDDICAAIAKAAA